MKNHSLTLDAEPFEAVAVGKKTIESRLFDEKRQAIRRGDIIVFTNRSNTSQTIEVKVIRLHRYKSFADLFAHNNPAKFGNEDLAGLLRQIKRFYTDKDEDRYGVIGIEFLLV